MDSPVHLWCILNRNLPLTCFAAGSRAFPRINANQGMSCNKLPLKPASMSAAAAARSNSQELARRSHADFWGVLDTAGVRGVPPREGFLEKASSSSKRPPLLPAIPSGTIPPFGLAERMASSPAYQNAFVCLFVCLFVCWFVGLFCVLFCVVCLCWPNTKNQLDQLHGRWNLWADHIPFYSSWTACHQRKQRSFALFCELWSRHAEWNQTT